ncbi:hypothetical protein [Gemella haemolysans]|jgi:hypothetical protein|uniref:Uncharacterized protein n=2 Tax=root TaxID=1 RepID=A0A133ZZW6_9BACL|nr:hypothetical protein [Gemella haemolysans]KXB60990.1 hypothetical protein HMPREF3186_00750 [Gemella haemolysans]PMC48648.1 hypothetical protein CJ217_01975 [Streptococcus sp. UMB1385]
MNKISEAKLRSNKKWDDNNRERKRYINKRSTARSFIKTMEREDIPEFEALLEERKARKD